MSSTYRPITILDPTTHIWNTQHWPHVQYVQSYLYFRPHHPHMEHNTDHMSSMYSPVTILDPTTHMEQTTLTTCPVRTESCHYFRPHHQHMEHTTLTTCPVCTVQSLFENIPPTYIRNNTDHMSSTYSPISILDSTTHLRNTQHWPHVQYVQSNHYFRPNHPHMEHITLTTCPVCTVQSLY